MTETKQIYKVFISSPGGLSKQREVAKQTVMNMSKLYDRRGIMFDPWLWEADSVSEFGSPAQTVITKQLGEYDIYVGIMGTRFGTSTDKFGSGTEQEFYEALEANKASGYPRVGFFFKSENVNTSKLTADDIDQLQKISKFRTTIGPLGLYREFTEDHQLSIEITNLLADAVEANAVSPAAVALQYSMYSDIPVRDIIVSKFFYNDVLNAIDLDISRENERLTLDDVWVEPDLKLLEGEEQGALVNQARYDFDVMAADLKCGQKLLLTGSETSGKTSICRRLYSPIASAKLFPILIDGQKINNPNFDRFEQRIRVAYNEQYDNWNIKVDQKFLAESCVLIIDDFDQAKLNPENLFRLLQGVCKQYHAVLLTAAPTFAFRLLGKAEEAGVLSNLRRIEIKDLGQRKRYALVERWCLTGKDVVDEANIRTLIEEKRRIVSRVLRSNLVPRTPMIVLILLKAMEVGQLGDLAKTGYVRYYKFLIDSAILKNVSSQDAEGAYALLPELAWQMHKVEAKELTPETAERVIEEFSKRKALSKTLLYSVLGSLRRIGMFESVDANHKFKFDYAYYYFLADYINQNIASSEMQGVVVGLCHNISNKESANILAFLAFHSDNKIIIETLIAGLETVYRDVDEFEFSKEKTAPINRLILDMPKQVVDYSNATEKRNRRLDYEEKSEEQQQNEPSDVAGNDVFQVMSNTFTSVEILGHIIRNHYARIDAEPKRVIVEAASKAILRCVGDMFVHLSASVDVLVVTVGIMSDKLNKEVKIEKKKQAAKKVVFLIAATFLVYCTRQLARSVGDENLEMTYRQVLEAMPGKTLKYLDVIIKLDSFKEFPFKEVKDLVAEFENEHLGMAALQYAVAERLDMRPPSNPSDLQKICDLVGLKLKARLAMKQRR